MAVFFTMMTEYCAEVTLFSCVWVLGDYIVRGLVSVITGRGIRVSSGGMV